LKLWPGQLSTLPCAVHLSCNGWSLHQRSSAVVRRGPDAAPHTHLGETSSLLLWLSVSTPAFAGGGVTSGNFHR
jgi:hypothetical protein